MTSCTRDFRVGGEIFLPGDVVEIECCCPTKTKPDTDRGWCKGNVVCTHESQMCIEIHGLLSQSGAGCHGLWRVDTMMCKYPVRKLHQIGHNPFLKQLREWAHG